MKLAGGATVVAALTAILHGDPETAAVIISGLSAAIGLLAGEIENACAAAEVTPDAYLYDLGLQAAGGAF